MGSISGVSSAGKLPDAGCVEVQVVPAQQALGGETVAKRRGGEADLVVKPAQAGDARLGFESRKQLVQAQPAGVPVDLRLEVRAVGASGHAIAIAALPVFPALRVHVAKLGLGQGLFAGVLAAVDLDIVDFRPQPVDAGAVDKLARYMAEKAAAEMPAIGGKHPLGGALALWFAGLPVSVPATVGFIALFGIALGNGMVLVSFMDDFARAGRDLDALAIEAAGLRARPVLMTAMTTALGLAPLLFATGVGAEVQRPLATVVTGGLVSSTVLTLLVMPALHRWFAPRQGGHHSLVETAHGQHAKSASGALT